MRVLSTLAAAILVLAAASCAGTTRVAPPAPGGLKPAQGVPGHFLVGNPTTSATEEPRSDGTCKSPMVDPRDGERLELVRSAGGFGDYEVPRARYGVGEGELLRIDCATGRAAGVVKR